MDDIRVELGVPTQSPFGINEARLGTYVSINQFSPSKPPSSGQVSLSSWYSYCQNCGYNSDTFYYSGASAAAACAGTPDTTLREISTNQKNIIGSKGNSAGMVNFNYKNGTPDTTLRELSANQKNITGTIGDGTQSRSRLDATNAYLNTAKEVVAEGRDPVPVKENRGPTTQFTEYVFCDDKSFQSKPVFSGTRPLASVPNELYSFSHEQ